ncbi:MAG: hypothetical protein OEU32_07365 [Acidimicrobiia bacterium]|nr:hypothetical protein [Acidimicrobiia bacterium]
MTITRAPFRRREKVVATEDLPRVPEGTGGRVMLVNGFSWIRYWVHFDNGVELGSIDQAKLVRAKEWETYRHERARLAEQADSTDVVDDAADGEIAAASAGESASVNGVAIPAYLLERSKDARTRFSA